MKQLKLGKFCLLVFCFFLKEKLEKLVYPKINVRRRTGGLTKPVILAPWITDTVLYTELKFKLVGGQSLTSHFQVQPCPGKVLGTFSNDITSAGPLSAAQVCAPDERARSEWLHTSCPKSYRAFENAVRCDWPTVTLPGATEAGKKPYFTQRPA